MPTIPLRERPSWKALEQHHAEIGGRHLRELFAEDPGRGERLTAEAAGLYLDYSKNRVTDETMRLLVELAEESGVAERRDAMFRGEHINVSENRAVLHVALRMPATEKLTVDGQDVVGDVHAVLGLSDGTTRGGHLLDGRVYPTLEAVVTETPARLRKVMRPDIGIALIDLGQSEA